MTTTTTNNSGHKVPAFIYASDNTAYPCNGDTYTTSNIPPGIYHLRIPSESPAYLERAPFDRFKRPENIYGSHEADAYDIVNTWRTLDRSMGVLYHGKEGTGKSVSMALVGNWMIDHDIPVIIVDPGDNLTRMAHFLDSSIGKAMVLMDEVDKGKKGDESSFDPLHGFLDGVGQRNFLTFLCCNDIDVMPSTLTMRPSRIRYIREFGPLKREEIKDILNRYVSDVNLREEILREIGTTPHLSYDQIFALIEEVTHLHRSVEDAVVKLNTPRPWFRKPPEKDSISCKWKVLAGEERADVTEYFQNSECNQDLARDVPNSLIQGEITNDFNVSERDYPEGFHRLPKWMQEIGDGCWAFDFNLRHSESNPPRFVTDTLIEFTGGATATDEDGTITKRPIFLQIETESLSF